MPLEGRQSILSDRATFSSQLLLSRELYISYAVENGVCR